MEDGRTHGRTDADGQTTTGDIVDSYWTGMRTIANLLSSEKNRCCRVFYTDANFGCK
jgi:hypothetical protein